MIYLLYKTRNIEHLEHFTVSDDVKQAINDIYKADINAIRNLSNFATEIMNNNDSLTIPAKTTTVTDLTINGKITGDLNVDGNVKFNNKNTNIMEIFPSGMILSWSGSIGSIPKGWATCDGRKYKIDTTGVAIFDSNGIATPDLRSRCILGAGEYSEGTYPNDGSPAASLTVRGVGNWSGSETHTLTIEEIPSHNHNIETGGGEGGSPPGRVTYWDQRYYNAVRDEGIIKPKGGKLREGTGGSNKDSKGNLIPPIYDTLPHNNMQPFYVLTYIMKL
jgi:microcystin-dependent protein